MPVSYQIVPEHRYPHVHTQINDYTTYTDALISRSGTPMLMFVFASPKGPDRIVRTITGGLAEFVKLYGRGSGAIYGQPYMNAYNCASGGNAVLQCMRVTAPDATYAHAHVLVKYRVDEDDEGNNVLAVKFVTTHVDNLTDSNMLLDTYTETDEPDDEGYTTRRLFSVCETGRGVSSKRFRISADTSSDKNNDYKNYFWEVMEFDGALQSISTDLCIFVDYAVVNELNMSTDVVVNSNPESYLKIDVNYDAFEEVFDLYQQLNPDTSLTVDTFDLLLGINKYTKKAIANFQIDSMSDDAVVFNSLTGVELGGGSDGAFTMGTTLADKKAREEAMNLAYLNAFTGATYDLIVSTNRYPTNLILDANFDLETKKAIAALTTKRGDCMCMLDEGISLPTKESIKTYGDLLEAYVNTRYQTIEAGYGDVVDPISKKVVRVSYLYNLAVLFPASWVNNNGKHVPVAGNEKGELSGFVNGSLHPILDIDVDQELMDDLTDMKINYLKYNQYLEPVRAQQNTRQQQNSDLSEQNNVLVLLDIKRDCIELCQTYEYQFAEASDLARFNQDIKILLDKYAEAQVRSITAEFGKSEWEAQRGIIHLYVTMAPKDLVKTTIIEIDVI